MIKVLVNGKELEKSFNKAEEIIDYAETLVKECNIVIWNDYTNFMTNIQIFDKTAEKILFDISFFNPNLVEEKEKENEAVVEISEFDYATV